MRKGRKHAFTQDIDSLDLAGGDIDQAQDNFCVPESLKQSHTKGIRFFCRAINVTMPTHAPLGEHFLDIVKAQIERGVEPDRVADDIGREAVTLGRELKHRSSAGPNKLSSQPGLCDNTSI